MTIATLSGMAFVNLIYHFNTMKLSNQDLYDLLDLLTTFKNDYTNIDFMTKIDEIRNEISSVLNITILN